MASTGRLYDKLAKRYGTQYAFKDVDSIPAGVDFAQHIREVLADCAVTLVVIGRQWMRVDPETGRPRLFAPHDFVRLEIETALALQIPVVPILVEGAQMPAAADLPPSLQILPTLNALEIPNDPFFDAGLRRAYGKIEPYLPAGMRPRVKAARWTAAVSGALVVSVLASLLAVLHFRPSPPETLGLPYGANALTGAVAEYSATGWVVGTGGVLLRVDYPHTPKHIDLPLSAGLYAVAENPSGEAWAVGAHGTAVHDRGGTWHVESVPASVDLYGIATAPDGTWWIVGAGGTILHRSNGGWSAVASPTTHALAHVAFAPDDTGWAVGRGGTILEYTGNQWHLMPSPTQETLFGLSVDAHGRAIAVGAQGTILSLSHGAWHAMPSNTTADLRDVNVQFDGSFQAVGLNGIVLRLVQSTWFSKPSPTQASLNATTQYGWLVGDLDTVLLEGSTGPLPVASPTQQILIGVAVGSNGDA
jgi:photosystem II stability/assembly factor-like uncharacterized protein